DRLRERSGPGLQGEASTIPRGGNSGDLDRRSLQTGTLGGDEVRIQPCCENRVFGPGGVDSRPRLLDRCLMAVARGAPLNNVLPSRNPGALSSGMEFRYGVQPSGCTGPEPQTEPLSADPPGCPNSVQ